MKSYKNLIERLEAWERILKLIRLLKPGGLYKFSNKEDCFIVMPHRYQLVTVSCYIIAYSTTRKTESGKPIRIEGAVGTKGRWVTLLWVYGYIINNFKVEPISISDLPLYVNAQYKGPMFEKLLKGDRKCT